MDLSLTQEEEQFRDELREWLAANHPGTSPPDGEDDWSWRRRWQQTLRSGDYLGLSWPREYGGRGATLVELVVCDGERAAVFSADEYAADPVTTIDLTRRVGRVVLRGDGEPLGGEAGTGLAQARIALAAECVGVAERAMTMAVDYAKVREQFGYPIGSNQAISHRCVQMLIEVEGARAATDYAAWCADHDPAALPLAAAAAKSHSSEAAWRVTASAIQVHGGIGFTWEHDLHHFVRRARLNADLLGNARDHRARIVELVAESTADEGLVA